MSAYLVLARKYRSETFDEVIGQEPISQTLVNAIKTNRVAHAYLFTGTRGVGKTTMARILAKALNCLAFDDATPEPCGKCDACESIARGEDMDVVEIDGASNRGIDEIRELRANAIFRPARCRYKIYYIDEVHMLTKEAFNALLKTLEEPPEHVKFIFATTECEKVPATILSRCQRFDFRNIPTAKIAEHLATICKAEKVSADDDALYRIARAGAGSMRDSLSLLDQLLAGGGKVCDEEVIRVLGTPPDEQTIKIGQAIADGNSAAALGQLATLLDSGVTITSVVTALGDTFRNMMLAGACGGDSELIELPEMQRKAVSELAARFSTPTLVQNVGIIQRIAQTLRGSSVGRALVEATLVRLAEADKFVDPSSLIERLEQLSAGGMTGGLKKKSLANPASPQVPTATPQNLPPSQSATSQTRSSAPPTADRSPSPGMESSENSAAPETAPAITAPVAQQHRPLSTEQRLAVQQDPAVQTVMTLFDGALVDVVKDPLIPEADDTDESPEPTNGDE
ncbi:MAG: DNA polymerase III subunit gamma/tau [Phycisphaerae bacterium]|nr:DNA polymerase III subunit gamma/tau [Phycisphaerae bacterium]